MDSLYSLALLAALAAAALGAISGVVGIRRPTFWVGGLAPWSVAAGLLLGAASLVVHLQLGHGPGAPEPMVIGQFVRVHPAYGIVLLISLLGFGAWLLSRAG